MSHPVDTSGLKTTSAVICNMPGKVVALTVLTDGTNDATAIVYDNATTNSGTVLAKLIVAGESRSGSLLVDCGILANRGIYLAVSGTGAEAIVHYIKG